MMYTQKSRCPETGRLSRKRNRFHSAEAERQYNARLGTARLVRKILPRNGHTIKYLMNYRQAELDTLRSLLTD